MIKNINGLEIPEILEEYAKDTQGTSWRFQLKNMDADQLKALICYEGWKKEAAVNDYFNTSVEEGWYDDKEEAEEQKAWFLDNATEVYRPDGHGGCELLGTIIDCRS